MKSIKVFSGAPVAALILALSFSAIGLGASNADTTQSKDSVVVWNGNGAGWMNPTTSTIQAETSDVHDSASALEFKFNDTGKWLGAGWNWFSFKKGDFGTDISKMQYLTFWVKSTGSIGDLQINLLSNGSVADTPEHHTDKVHLSTYCPSIADGAWHQVKIPLSALTQPTGFNAEHVCEMQLGMYADHPLNGSFVFDDIAFQP